MFQASVIELPVQVRDFMRKPRSSNKSLGND
jgi:hypothetical protein